MQDPVYTGQICPHQFLQVPVSHTFPCPGNRVIPPRAGSVAVSTPCQRSWEALRARARGRRWQRCRLECGVAAASGDS